MPATFVHLGTSRQWAHPFPPLTLRVPQRGYEPVEGSASLRTPRPKWAIGAFSAPYPTLPMTVLVPIYTDAELDDIENEAAPLT